MRTDRLACPPGIWPALARSLMLLCLLGASGWAQAQPGQVYALTNANQLVTFSPATPGTLSAPIALTGLAMGETLQGIDFRPATGELYALGLTNATTVRILKIDLATGAAAPVSASTISITGTIFGFSFNPVTDSLRLVSNTDINKRINPTTGALAGTDTTLAYATGDPHFGANPNVVRIAHANQATGTSATTLYGIDSSTASLVRIGGSSANPSPNSGELTTIGPLGVAVTAVGAFDIQAGTNLAYAAFTTAGSSFLATINLATGAADQIFFIGTGTTVLNGFAVTAPLDRCLDIDGNGTVDALTDGLMLLRMQMGLTGTGVTSGALPTPPPPRATWSAIRAFMNANCGTSFGP